MAVASNDKNIIYFTVFSTAVDFLKRNFTKKDMIGLITIPEDEFVNLKEKHRLECFSFPKKLQKIDIEVIELKCDIELQVHQKVS